MDVIKVELTPSTNTVCGDSGSASYSLTTNSFTPGGVTWSISPTNGVSISGGTVALSGASGSYTVFAISQDNTNCFDTATLEAVHVELTPETNTVCGDSGSAVYSLTNSYTPGGVTWEVSPTNGASISGGTVTLNDASGSYTVFAISIDDTNCFDTATLEAVHVELTPETNTVCGDSGSAVYSLTNSYTPGGVTWEVSPTNGASISGGTVTLNDASGSYTVLAISIDDTNCFDTATLEAVHVELTPETNSFCGDSGSAVYSLTNSYTPSGVTWEISPTNGASISDGTVTLSGASGSYTVFAISLDDTNCFDTAVLIPVSITLSNMTFDAGWDIERDEGGTYPTPHWTATNSSPYLYRRSTLINATATFSVEPSSFVGSITIAGDGPNALDFTNRTVSVSGGVAVYPATYSVGALTNHVDFWNQMEIDWLYGEGTNSPSNSAGMSANMVYVSLVAPAGTRYHTVVHLACSVGGATNEPTAFTNTWSQLAGPANVTTWDSKPLYYYRDGFGWDNSALNTAQLLLSANSTNAWAGHGQCGSFANLLIDSLRINGISSDWVTAEATNGDFFIVKDWGFSATPSYSSEPNYKWRLTLVWEAAAGYPGMVPAPAGSVYGDLTKQATLIGQNTAPPSEEWFIRHFFVKYGGSYYDPSYGGTYSDENDFEDQAVEGYVVPDVGLDFKVRESTGLGNITLNP
jgi:hypothetical protein